MRWNTSAENFRLAFSSVLQGAADSIESHRFVEIGANRPPWTATGIKLVAGDRVSLFCVGRAWLKSKPSAWVGAHFGLWIRVGTRGPIFRAARGSCTFTAVNSGELYLGNIFPGAWADETGALASPSSIFDGIAGTFEALVIRWRHDASQGLERMAHIGGPAAELVAAELQALRSPVQAPPGWVYLWSAGDAECFVEGGARGIRCEIVDDAAILQKTVRAPLEPSTRLRWSWKIDRLPSNNAEDSVANHDYLSVAVEFDNGKDLTYIWSSSLEPERAFQCPIASWRDRETHLVIRSGAEELGRWISEERSVWQDYRRAVGPAPSQIVGVWLIAVSIFQHGLGRCEYRAIELVNGSETLPVS